MTPTLPFSNLSATSWGPVLDSLVGKKVIVPVFWGAHEQTPGIRDYVKSSRLRLEKFFRLAQEKNVSLLVRFGFPPGGPAFPRWTQALLPRICAPAFLGGETALVKVPSLAHPEFREGFLDFGRELMELLALYAHPDGPVTGVEFDPGPYAHEQPDPESPADWAILDTYRARYGDVSKLNTFYQTSFSTFDGPTTQKVLADRRPWLSAYDHKLARRRRIEALAEEGGFPSAVVHAEPLASREWCAHLDGTLVENRGRAFEPFLIGGRLCQTSAAALRLAELVAEESPLHVFDGSLPPEGVAHRVVLCGRFLDSKSAAFLRREEERGVELDFPLEIPRLDENLEPLEWKTKGPSSFAPAQALRARLAEVNP